MRMTTIENAKVQKRATIVSSKICVKNGTEKRVLAKASTRFSAGITAPQRRACSETDAV